MEEKEKKYKELHECYVIIHNDFEWGAKELLKYEQQLKSQPKEIVEKIKERILKIDKTEIKTLENGYSTLYCDRPTVITILDDILKEYKGE